MVKEEVIVIGGCYRNIAGRDQVVVVKDVFEGVVCYYWGECVSSLYGGLFCKEVGAFLRSYVLIDS